HRELLVRKIKVRLEAAAQIAFNHLLILRGGRDEFGVEDSSRLIKTITVVEYPARRFGTATACPTTGSHNRCRLGGWLVGFDDLKRVITGIDRFNCTHDNALERIVASRINPAA